jgi:hypothetical protein
LPHAKAPNQAKIQADIEDWGLDSDYIRVNVLGEFPRQDADTLIPLPLIEAARVASRGLRALSPDVGPGRCPLRR